MTDDLEPRLADHLRHRASRVSAPPDVADVHHRIDARHRRRAACAAARRSPSRWSPVPWLAGRSARAAEPDRDTVTAAGGGDASDSGDDASGGAGADLEGTHRLPRRRRWSSESDRTTAEGIRLGRAHHPARSAEPDRAQIDGLVRVGIVDDELIDVALLETGAGHASFVIAGAADGRPMWVVVAASHGHRRRRPSRTGRSTRTEAAGGVAVLAAYADDGQPAAEPGRRRRRGHGRARADRRGERPPGHHRRRQRRLHRGRPLGRPARRPDDAASRASRPPTRTRRGPRSPTLFTRLYDGSGEPHLELHERPEVWVDANERFQAGAPGLRRHGASTCTVRSTRSCSRLPTERACGSG